MPTQDQKVDGKSLKRFVANLVKAEKLRLLPGQTAKPRAMHQEDVAAFFGFSSWIDLWTRVVTNHSMQPVKRLAAPWAERPFTARAMPRFWRWVKDKGVDAISLDIGSPLSVNQPPRYTHLAPATTRTMQQGDIECFLVDLLGRDFDLHACPEGTYQFITCAGQPLRWRVDLDITQAGDVSLRLDRYQNRVEVSYPLQGLSELLREHRSGMLVVSHSFCNTGQTHLEHIVDAHLGGEHTPALFCYRPPNESFDWNPPIDEAHFDLSETGAEAACYTQAQRETLRGRPHVVCIDRCEDEVTLAQALTACEDGALVFMGVVGGDRQHRDESLQRVPDAVVRLLNTMNPKTWKEDGWRLIENCHAVVSTCYSHNMVEVTETLAFTPLVRQALLEALEAADIPQDLYAPLVHLTLAHGRDFVEDAIAQGLPERDFAWIEYVQSEWRQRWAPEASSASKTA